MSSAAITTLVKMMETLPEGSQDQVVEHVRDYIAEMQDEQQGDIAFQRSQKQLIAAARRAKQEIAAGKTEAMALWKTSPSPTRKAYQLRSQNPFHPSLHFKCIDPDDGIWSVRVTLGYRALGIGEGDTVTWFWIGGHDAYEQYFG